MDLSYVHIRYFIGYVYHICLQDTIQSTLSLCLLCQAMLLPMPLRPLLLTTQSGFSVRHWCLFEAVSADGAGLRMDIPVSGKHENEAPTMFMFVVVLCSLRWCSLLYVFFLK